MHRMHHSERGNMKKRKKLIKRIGAGVCALILVFGCMGTVPYYAGENSSECEEWFLQNKDLYLYRENVNLQLPDACNDYSYYRVYHTDFNGSRFVLYLCNKAYTLCGEITKYENNSVLYSYALFTGGYDVVYSSSDGITWNVGSPVPSFITCNFNFDGSYDYLDSSYNTKLVYSNYDLCGYVSGKLFLNGYAYDSFNKPESYNSSLGYLQNVSRKSTYIRDFLYNYDDDSLTYHWYHDLQSTSGVDLTSGEYKIRHYISNATVKGYEKDDIVEMSEKYLMAEYDASQGYFTYLQKDYLEKLESLGYVDPSWIDIYFKGYFVLQHHYFQIVNTSTNEVGGYLHIYPKDATDDNFGVELMYEGTDLDGNIDEDAPNGYFDSTTGSGETLEDALENADEPKFDDLSGMQEFIDTIETYGSQVENVSKGFGALLGEFPPWFLGVLGFSFALLFIVVIVSAMKG